jgi:hypothetical protein
LGAAFSGDASALLFRSRLKAARKEKRPELLRFDISCLLFDIKVNSISLLGKSWLESSVSGVSEN